MAITMDNAIGNKDIAIITIGGGILFITGFHLDRLAAAVSE